VEFEWDPEKAESNFRKHRVRFAEATKIFNDHNFLTMLDEMTDEERYIAVGFGSRGRVLSAVYTVRGESVRLISARKATRAELEQYENRK
jgi:uncharacterized DUF497 family protein